MVEIWVGDLPGLSYRRFVLAERGDPRPDAPASTTQPSQRPVVLDNRYFRLAVDPHRGVVTSWFDKRLGRELVDQNDPWGFGRFIYARGGEGTRLMSNQADLPEGDPDLLVDFALRTCRVERSALGQAVTLVGTVPYGTLEVEWSLPNHAKWVDVRFAYDKEERREKEAAYVAFPCAIPGAKVRSDSQLGWVDWERDSLPGACAEWLPLQTGILVSGEDAAVLVCSPDVPLFCIGDLVRGRWRKHRELTGGRLFSYVLNNYWHTNYRPAQGGQLTFSYRLTSDAAIGFDRAFRLGWQTRRPLYAQRMSFQDFRAPRAPYLDATGGTLAEVGTEQVVLSTMKQARRSAGWIIRLQEIAGRDQFAPIRIPGRRIVRAWRTNLLEEEIGELLAEPDGTLRVSVPAWSLATVRCTLAADGY